jgi:hypothetical protein
MADKKPKAKKSSGSSAVSKILNNPLYEVVIHTIAKFAEDSVHDPDSRDELKKGLQPLYDALQDLYAADTTK